MDSHSHCTGEWMNTNKESEDNLANEVSEEKEWCIKKSSKKSVNWLIGISHFTSIKFHESFTPQNTKKKETIRELKEGIYHMSS